MEIMPEKKVPFLGPDNDHLYYVRFTNFADLHAQTVRQMCNLGLQNKFDSQADLEDWLYQEGLSVRVHIVLAHRAVS